jgi:hypothetical protein
MAWQNEIEVAAMRSSLALVQAPFSIIRALSGWQMTSQLWLRRDANGSFLVLFRAELPT